MILSSSGGHIAKLLTTTKKIGSAVVLGEPNLPANTHLIPGGGG
jgi:hypothetical protein